MATWADRFDEAQRFNRANALAQAQEARAQQEYEYNLAQRNALNNALAAGYVPGTPDQTIDKPIPGPVRPGIDNPLGSTQTVVPGTPGGLNMSKVLQALYQGGNGQAGLALQNAQEQQMRPFQQLILEAQLKQAIQNQQWDRARSLMGGVSGGGYGSTLKIGPNGPEFTFDPSKAAQTNIDLARLRDQGISMGGNGAPAPVAASSESPATSGMSPAQQRELAANRAKTQPSALASLNNLMANYDMLGNGADSLLTSPGLNMGTGATYWTGNIPGTPAKGFATDLDTLKNQIALGTMQALKAASATGSTGFGQLSNAEGDLLKNNIANLNPSRSKQDMIRSIQAVSDYSLGAKKRAIEAYVNEYGASPQTDALMKQVDDQISARASGQVPGPAKAAQVNIPSGLKTGTLNGRRVFSPDGGKTAFFADTGERVP